jgi:hypothetical protein
VQFFPFVPTFLGKLVPSKEQLIIPSTWTCFLSVMALATLDRQG